MAARRARLRSTKLRLDYSRGLVADMGQSSGAHSGTPTSNDAGFFFCVPHHRTQDGVDLKDDAARVPKSSASSQLTSYFVDTLLTTPWIGCVPKCPVAGPVYTRVTLENESSDPPMMQTWRVDAPLASKVAGPPFPVVVAVPLTTRPETVVGGLLAGQTLVS